MTSGDVIRLLPDSVANQIAAGEVIQRPASVIKELVENAVDAGAKNIEVLVTDAGKTCIRVIDDGRGMSETDARMAFERHATSKIREAADLFALHTMGFRGEALASIAAVAQVELKTCSSDDGLGTFIQISGSQVEKQEAVACQRGSDFSVKNLIFNVPARRKFLKSNQTELSNIVAEFERKSNQTELSNIVAEFERIALVNPDISFVLSHNGTEMLNLPAIPLRQRIMGVFGKKLNQELLSLDIDTTMVKIHGYIGRPESARKKGARQFFFVNGRYMRHPYFHKAVSSAYDNLIPVGEQVSYFIYFEVEPSDIDVNIHPTKTEIKFENEQAVWQILSAAVKETLGRFNAVPSIDFDTEGMPDIPAFENSPYTVAPPQTSFDPSYNPFNTAAVPPSAYSSASTTNKETERESFGQDVREWSAPASTSVRSSMNKGGMPDFGRSGNYTPSFGSHKNRVEWEPLFEGLERTSSEPDIQPEEEVRPFFPESTDWGQTSQEDAVVPSFSGEENEKQPQENSMGQTSQEDAVVPSCSGEENEKQPQENSMRHYQYKGSYILTSVKSGLMIINQQRAHIRILFDRYMAQIENRKTASQRMLFPDMVHFSPSEVPVLEEFMDDLNALGFDLSSLGGGTYSINGIPAGIEGLNPEKLVTDMVQTAIEKGCKVKEEVQSMLALSLAKAAAIVPGQVLTDEEMNRLVDDLFAVSTPNYTPDGKTVLAVLKEDDLEKMFK